MNNFKYAYGWSGHIIAKESDYHSENFKEMMLENNVIAVCGETFDRIATDMAEMKLPLGVKGYQLGSLFNDPIYIAVGRGFTERFEFYGGVFLEAEIRLKESVWADLDEAYLEAMEKHYDLKLPPCRMMVGCASDQ
jgi:hypothetical protein